MRVRRILAVICYLISLGAYAGAGYVSWLSYAQDISYKLGFMMFLPIWIVSYWFSTFFSQLCERRRGDKTELLVEKSAYRILLAISNLIAGALLVYWGYIYFFLYRGSI